MHAHVVVMDMHSPTPRGTPLWPVLNRYKVQSCLSRFCRSKSAYRVERRVMNSAPTHSLSLIPCSLQRLFQCIHEWNYALFGRMIIDWWKDIKGITNEEDDVIRVSSNFWPMTLPVWVI